MLNPHLNLNKNLFNKDVLEEATRDGFGKALVLLGDKNPNIVVLSADLTETTRCEEFAQKYPNRFFEVGVAEQNMAAIAAGLGVSGKTAFICSYATFSPGKNWETIRTTIVYNNANVKIAGHHSGVATGPDGVTHQATEDIAITRCWPNIDIVIPCDSIEAKKATIALGKTTKPSYLRLTRAKTPIITTAETPFSLGKLQTFWISESPQVTIFASGYMLYHALLAAKKLEEEKINVLVVNFATIKPLDKYMLIRLAKQTGAFVSVEDHQIAGGTGSAIAEFLARYYPIPMEFIGLDDTFAESGSLNEIIKKYKMDSTNIVTHVKKVIHRKRIIAA